jgi:hypothetical protein
MNKTIAIVSGVFILVVVGVSFALSFVSPLRFIDADFNNTPITRELQTTLQLHDRYFLLTSALLMENEIQSFDYVRDVKVERVWPNQLHIDVEANVPVACNERLLYYVDVEIPRTTSNEQLCQHAALVLSEDISMELRSELRSLDLLLLQQITAITEYPDYMIVRLHEMEVTLYPDQLVKLSSILNQEISSNSIDIRANYA